MALPPGPYSGTSTLALVCFSCFPIVFLENFGRTFHVEIGIFESDFGFNNGNYCSYSTVLILGRLLVLRRSLLDLSTEASSSSTFRFVDLRFRCSFLCWQCPSAMCCRILDGGYILRACVIFNLDVIFQG